MKTLEFKTSKGSFMLVDSIEIEGIKLSEITEEQASEITESMYDLHSLLKSKGVYLYENPVKFTEYIDGYPDGYLDAIQQETHLAEQKTFYNPVIFKL